jgi:hypothetical protein
MTTVLFNVITYLRYVFMLGLLAVVNNCLTRETHNYFSRVYSFGFGDTWAKSQSIGVFFWASVFVAYRHPP